MTFWIVGLFLYALLAFLVFACMFVGGPSDSAMRRFLKERERDQ